MPPYRCVVGPAACSLNRPYGKGIPSPPLRSLAEDSFGMSEYRSYSIVSARARESARRCPERGTNYPNVASPCPPARRPTWDAQNDGSFPRPKREMFIASSSSPSSFGTHVPCPISRGVNKRPFCAAMAVTEQFSPTRNGSVPRSLGPSVGRLRHISIVSHNFFVRGTRGI